MADEVVFEMLHNEMIDTITADCDNDAALSKLEALGFRVGQSIIES